MKGPVIKVKFAELPNLLSGFIQPYLRRDNWGYNRFPRGKAVLSVKIGKRRRLVKGQFIETGFETSRDHAGYVWLRFVANNSDRFGFKEN